jgi:hypothetical protein
MRELLDVALPYCLTVGEQMTSQERYHGEA